MENEVFVLIGDLNASFNTAVVATTKEKIIEEAMCYLHEYENEFGYAFDYVRAKKHLSEKNFWSDTAGNCFWLQIIHTNIVH